MMITLLTPATFAARTVWQQSLLMTTLMIITYASHPTVGATRLRGSIATDHRSYSSHYKVSIDISYTMFSEVSEHVFGMYFAVALEAQLAHAALVCKSCFSMLESKCT